MQIIIVFILLLVSGCIGQTETLQIVSVKSADPPVFASFQSKPIKVNPVEDRRATAVLFEIKNQYGQTVINYEAQPGFVTVLTTALRDKLRQSGFSVVDQGQDFVLSCKLIDTEAEDITGWVTVTVTALMRSEVTLRNGNMDQILWSDLFIGRAKKEYSWGVSKEEIQALYASAMSDMISKIASSPELRDRTASAPRGAPRPRPAPLSATEPPSEDPEIDVDAQPAVVDIMAAGGAGRQIRTR